jgi:hypothetical protein
MNKSHISKKEIPKDIREGMLLKFHSFFKNN